jgi:hypothetical protein
VTLTATDVAAPLARYARRLHALAGPSHHVASPLGAWLLLALCAPASTGQTRNILNATLGLDSADAAELAAALLASPHPLVPAAAAVWFREAALADVASRWLATLPPEVETGPLTGQADLDDWARRYTFGLIKRFPVALDPSRNLLAATVLATRVSWERPFDVAPGSALGPSSPWAGLSRVLRTPDGPGHEQFVAATETAGDVAVHIARARDGLLVTSVAAAPGVPAPEVLAAAYDVALARAAGVSVPRRSLFDLPLGEGPLWTVSERTAMTRSAAGHEERCTAVLPAWSARSQHDLSDPGLGFAAAAQALAPGAPWQARQAAMARYGRVGFEAAAVTGMAVAMAMMRGRQGLIRTAELRFGHPFAVVAVTVDGNAGPQARVPGRGEPGPGMSPWHGLPVFSAWVAQPEEPTPGTNDRGDLLAACAKKFPR